MKSLWKGTIKLGFVSQPVAVYGASDPSAAIKFNQLHATCRGRINEKVFCPTCQVDVARAELLKGHEHSKGQYVVVSADELKKCEVETTQVIDLKEFVPAELVRPWYIATTHYIAPEKAALADAFALIRDALDGYAGIGTLAIRGRELLVAIVPNGRGLMMHTLRHADEIRDIAEVDMLTKVPAAADEKTIGLMRQLIAGMKTETLSLEKYPDTYRTNLQAVIDRKIAGGEDPAASASAPPPTSAASVMDALKASLAILDGGKAEEEPKKSRKKSAA